MWVMSGSKAWRHGLGTRPGNKAVGNVWEQGLGIRPGDMVWGQGWVRFVGKVWG